MIVEHYLGIIIDAKYKIEYTKLKGCDCYDI